MNFRVLARRMKACLTLKAAFGMMMDMPVDENSATTLRQLVEQRWPGLQVNHIHSAGTASGVVDGAAGLLLASPDYARAHGMKPSVAS